MNFMNEIERANRYVEYLESLLRRQEKILELEQLLIRDNKLDPNEYSDFENDCKKDVEALRFVIDFIKWGMK